jgi:hypothetical protein
MLDFLKTKFRRPGQASPFLEVDDAGLSIDDGEQPRQFAWNDLRQIRACKVDCGSGDAIQIELEFADGTWLEVEDVDSGYRELVAAIEQRFELLDGWWCPVAYPALAANLTVLWTHPDFFEPPLR